MQGIRKGTGAYLSREDLAVIPSAKEENVATIVDNISCSDYTVYLQWPLKGIAFYFCDFNRVDLHSPPDLSTQLGVAWYVVGKEQGAQYRCMQPSEVCVRNLT